MTRAARVLVIANPAAGLRRRRDPGASVVRAIEAAGTEAVLERTRAPGDARRLAAAAVKAGFDLVVAVGGDGTANEVANGVAGTGVAMGIAPAGTMNLLARVLSVPLDPLRAAKLAVAGRRTVTLRPGRAGETVFLLMAGIGFDAFVLRRLLAGRTRKITMADYARGALAGVTAYPFPRIRFDCRFEGSEETLHGTSGIVGRAPLYGGFLRPTPRASLARDELELCALDIPSAGGYLRLIPSLWSASHIGKEGVRSRLVTEVRVSSDDPDVPVQLDGEPHSVLPIELGLSSRELLIAV